jgi:tetratricopeptide (TPR) repeat protein
MDWSWGLLNEAEQIFLQQLSVFAGCWTLESAQAVCDGDTLGLTNALVKKSLIVVKQASERETRYRFHEIVRQYMHEKLTQSGRSEVIRDRHLQYFMELAIQSEPELYRANRASWLNKLRDELDNLRLTLKWALKTNTASGLRLIVASWDFWLPSDYIGEMENHLMQLLEKYKEADSLRARALVVYAHLFADIGDFSKSYKIANQSLKLSRAVSDKYAEAASLFRLGWISDNGRDFVEQSIVLFRKIGDKRSQALAMEVLGQATNDPEQSKAILLKALRLHREIDYVEGIAKCQETLAGLFIGIGDFSSAISLLSETLEIYRQLGNRGGESGVLSHYGSIAYWEGDYLQAYKYHQEAITLRENDGTFFSLWSRIRMAYTLLRMGNISQAKDELGYSSQGFHKIGLSEGVVFAIEGIADLYVARNSPQKAAWLIGWADATREKINDTRPQLEQADVDKLIVACLTKMGEVAFSDAYDEGQKMTMEQAIDYALGEN